MNSNVHLPVGSVPARSVITPSRPNKVLLVVCLLNSGSKMSHGGHVTRSGVISDDLWDVIAEVMLTSSPRRGRPWNGRRVRLEAICRRFRAGSPWRDIPDEFGQIARRKRKVSEAGGHRPSTRRSTGTATPFSGVSIDSSTGAV